MGSLSLAHLAPRLQSFVEATTAGKKIFETINRIPHIDSMDEGGQKPDLKGTIQFHHVGFIYPSRPEGIYYVYNAE